MKQITNGNRLVYIEEKIDQSGKTFYPQDTYIPSNPHAHDAQGGGEIALNAWHSAFVEWMANPAARKKFFRFTTIEDDNGDYIEILDGIAINNPYIETSPQYNEEFSSANPPKYQSCWGFLYDAGKIESRWGNV